MIRKLNVGCGQDIKKGYVNLDKHTTNGADLIHDLNILPLPFYNDFFDEVYCSHVLEDFANPVPILDEFVRITKSGGIIHIRVPNPFNTWCSIYHKRGFDFHAFEVYEGVAVYGTKQQVKLIKKSFYYTGEYKIARLAVKILNKLPKKLWFWTNLIILFKFAHIEVKYKKL